ncbi:MAG: hypothetical protein LBL84_03255 [Candidatus Nomurabacteria bacterium]|jgi:hypothetical protein|nr:hypothetical protein [Candidatus Nomurabacteria bacterium]
MGSEILKGFTHPNLPELIEVHDSWSSLTLGFIPLEESPEGRLTHPLATIYLERSEKCADGIYRYQYVVLSTGERFRCSLSGGHGATFKSWVWEDEAARLKYRCDIGLYNGQHHNRKSLFTLQEAIELAESESSRLENEAYEREHVPTWDEVKNGDLVEIRLPKGQLIAYFNGLDFIPTSPFRYFNWSAKNKRCVSARINTPQVPAEN